jgi:cyclophilin family peptidyl-prolyl cis-trans isomerase
MQIVQALSSIVLDDSQFLESQYTVFGIVTEGMDIVDKIASIPTNEKDQPVDPEQARIKSVRIGERQRYLSTKIYV